MRFFAVIVVFLGGLLILGTNVASSEEVVCSAMRGQLVLPNGAAVSNVEILRQWSWRGKSGQDRTRTDASGRFAFDKVPAKRGLLGRLPAEEAVMQRYFAELPDGPFEFLYITRHDLTLNGETGGAAFNLRCTAGGEGSRDGFAWGTCILLP